MPIIAGVDKAQVRNEMLARDAKFFHACQLADFLSYIKLGGIPSRAKLASKGLDYTWFDTDTSDQAVGVWDKVFGNFSDFGFAYALGRRNERTAPTPNPYGPILIEFSPDFLDEANDISITLRSAGRGGYNRDLDSINSSRFCEIYDHIDISGISGWDRSRVAYSNVLAARFGLGARSPEFNCDLGSGLVSSVYFSKIIVDRYTVDNVSLVNTVSGAVRDAGWSIPVYGRRYFNEARIDALNELSLILLGGDVSLESVSELSGLSRELKGWLDRLVLGKRSFDFSRFIRYLRSGTLDLIS